jgi:hypothetical protein
MATEESSGVLPVQPVRAIQDPPVIFCDGVLSQSFAPGISKFYLFRTDASPDVTGKQKHPGVADSNVCERICDHATLLQS